MTVSLLGYIKRYQGVHADVKPTADDVPVGSTFYETETTDTYVYNGATWDAAPAFNGLFMPTADEKDALDGAAAPDAVNVFATMADITDAESETMTGGDLSGDLPAPVVESIHGGAVLTTSVTDGLSFYGASAVEAADRPAIPTQAIAVSVSDFNALRDHLIAIGLILDGD